MLGRRDLSQKGGEMKPIFLEDKAVGRWNFLRFSKFAAVFVKEILENIEQCCLMGKAWAKGKDL